MVGRQTLPTNVRPFHYDLTLTPDLEDFTFKGSESITLNINENTKTITLNANQIEVQTAKLNSIDSSDISYDDKKQTVTFTFPSEVQAGTLAVLHIDFTGIINDKMNGFYRSSYTDASGNQKYLATTQFEATDARRAFPCWDEPAIKATFNITLIVPSDLVALSNMNVISEKPVENNKKEVKFSQTPIMSTYLVAFLTGDLAYIERYTTGEFNEKPVLIRVYAIKGSETQGAFALDVATKALDHFSRIFEIQYPLPKLDMVAIPDFEAGAMENWGLVTYRTAAILFDPKASDARFKQRVAYTVAHELAHQWFGNLVTMEWWDHLWLNEGFATWVGYLAIDEIFPDWDIWTQFVVEGLQLGLKLDSLRSSHPIEVPVNDPGEIYQIFDSISYYKGASVIRMLSSYLGVDVLLAGVRRYLNAHLYGNASTDDLWESLSKESGYDVGNFMTGWTRKIGYPVLNVTEPQPNTIHIKQTRFLSTGDVAPEDDTTIWWVPLGITLGKSTPANIKSQVLTTKEAEITFPQVESDFFKLDTHEVGIFRVNYIPERLKKLGKSVKNGELTNISDRVGIVADAGALAVSGYGKTSGFLNLVNEFGNEDQYIVWVEMNTRIADIVSVWFEQPEPIYQGLLSFQRNLSSKLAHRLGWEYPENEDYLTTMLRSFIIKVAGKAGDPEIVKEAKRRFELFTEKNDQSVLHPNIRGAVFEIVLRHGGGEKEFEAILNIFRNSPTADQQICVLVALGSVQQPELIQRALEFSISPEVRHQDVIYSLSGLQINRKARKPLWDFIKQNWDLFEGRYAKSLSLFGHIIKCAIESLSSDEAANDVEKFFANKDTKAYARSLEQSLENIRKNTAWLKRDAKDVEEWLAANGYLKNV
ncbi:7007_t:CDS:10 [Ambispora gerdemannii]|uniref:Aminopeptidase n=1 Tax=Ambispora gerdemannii TaxID=144530 RepID=A0A9N8ZYX8_9GLOM|nr:7007_t:CDS:10 [Ambispora gerdemannii]